MPKCPHCKRQFKTLEDEPADKCPYCGWKPNYGLNDESVCKRCFKPFTSEGNELCEPCREATGR
jgi:hypothetical protein